MAASSLPALILGLPVMLILERRFRREEKEDALMPYYNFELRLSGRLRAATPERAMELCRELSLEVSEIPEIAAALVDSVTPAGVLLSEDQEPE